MAKPPAKHPNLFELSGGTIHATYSTSGFDGKPHFSYQDAIQSKSFTGDQIHAVQTDIGTLVTVVIRMTVDTGSTSFSLLIPNVNLTFSDSASITTIGITTVHKFFIFGVTGQTELYTVHQLSGTAAFVVF